MEANDVQSKEVGRRRGGGRSGRTTKYEECNVLLPPVRYTFHRISLGYVRQNNKDENPGRKDWTGETCRGLHFRKR